jgi:stage III sporulation protein AH
MNNKRQTIWLVSMLSLMVILSAYYLFTEDVTPAQTAAGGQGQTENSGYETSGNPPSVVEVTEADPPAEHPDASGAAGTPEASESGSAADDGAGTNGGTADSGSGTGAATGKEGAAANTGGSAEGAVSPEDEAVLQGMANLSGQMITELQRLRQEKFASENERLSAIVADTRNATQEEASTAAEELTRLEELDNRVTALEEKLLQDYDNAVVTEHNTNYQIIVQVAKLQKKQAVHIIDLAAKELNVTPDRLSVKYVP